MNKFVKGIKAIIGVFYLIIGFFFLVTGLSDLSVTSLETTGFLLFAAVTCFYLSVTLLKPVSKDHTTEKDEKEHSEFQPKEFVEDIPETKLNVGTDNGQFTYNGESYNRKVSITIYFITDKPTQTVSLIVKGNTTIISRLNETIIKNRWGGIFYKWRINKVISY